VWIQIGFGSRGEKKENEEKKELFVTKKLSV
jgi:hypothetical protein